MTNALRRRGEEAQLLRSLRRVLPSAPMHDVSAARASARSLPIVGGTEHLAFRCTSCGNCCRSLRVAVTHHDLFRLVEASGDGCANVVAWLTPDEVDMSGEPASFVELAAGRRLMVLAQAQGACRFLDGDARCRVYAARPADCRVFPFHLDVQPERARVNVSLLHLVDCDYARDGAVDPERLANDDARRWQELAEYQQLVERWNRLARHRRRMRHRVGTEEDFFAFLHATRPALATGV